MSKILFVNGNLHGHINPTLPIIKELVQRGDEVYYFSTKEFQFKLEAAGAIFMDYGAEFDQFHQSFRPHGAHPFYTLMEYMLGLDRAVVPIVLKKIEGMTFDCLIHDVMFGGGSILSDKLHIKSIASCSSFVMEKPPIPPRMLEPGFHPQLDYLYSELKAAQTEWQAKDLQISDIFFKKAPLTLVYTSSLFQPLGDSFDTSFQFVGPSVTDRNEVLDFPIATDRELVYITLGTVISNRIEFYNKCIEAFADDNYQVVMSVGDKTDLSVFNNVPNSFIIRNYIPQLEVLKQTAVLISHGGLNSVSEALYYGVPVIAIPISNDQPAVARRLAELGAGIDLKMEEITPNLLRQTVKTILEDPGFKENSIKIRETFRLAGGYQKAVDIIENYIQITLK